MSDLSDIAKEKYITGGGWNLQVDHVENWAYLEGVFTPEECSKIIQVGNQLITVDAEILGKDSLEYLKFRKSSISWIYPSKNNNWIFQRLAGVVNHLNSEYFKFDLFSFTEGLQFTRYYAPDGHYTSHIDRGPNFNIRKLSLSIQLNDSSDFDGGDLCLFFSDTPDKPPMKQGKAVAFPSYILHKVEPVTRGTRYSLVAWVSGPPFK